MGLFLLLTLNLLVITSARANIVRTIEGQLPEMGSVRKFLELFIQPYIQSATRKSYQETLVDKVIAEKMEQLKPFLQDHDDVLDTPDTLQLEGTDETTIIEVEPKPVGRERKHKNKDEDKPKNKTPGRTKNTSKEKKEKRDEFKLNIDRYKKMRRKIINMLQKESVSKKTEKMVAKSLDEMIQDLVKNQCSWKGVSYTNKSSHQRSESNSKKELNSQEWEEVKKHYVNLLENKNVYEALSFLQQSVNFFSKLSEVYNIKCKVADNKIARHIGLRTHNKSNCDNFMICSQELQDFLKSYYLALNNSAVSAFRNYAEMYSRDVNNEIHLQKDKVISVVNNVSNTVERIVSKMVRKEIIQLNLDANINRDANIRILKEFVNNTGERVIKHVAKHMESDFTSLKQTIVTHVQKDIDVNLRMDIESLQKQFLNQICKLFTVCNGNYIIKGDSRRKLHLKDGNSVYVKVQLNFEEDMKNDLARNNIQYLKAAITDRPPLQVTVKRSPATRTTSGAPNTRYTPSMENTVIDSYNLFPRKTFKDTYFVAVDAGQKKQLVSRKNESELQENPNTAVKFGKIINSDQMQLIDLD